MKLDATFGDIIYFEGDQEYYIVLANYGDSGKVQLFEDPETVVDPFYWGFEGSKYSVVYRHASYTLPKQP